MPQLHLDESIVAQLRQYVTAGEYADPSAVIREGLRWINARVVPAEDNHALQEARAEYDPDGADDWPGDSLDETGRADDEETGRRVSIELDADVVERIAAVLGNQTGHADFADESAVVSRALYLLEDRKKLLHLRKLIAEAEAQVARGECIPWRPGMMADIRERARQMARNGVAPKSDVI